MPRAVVRVCAHPGCPELVKSPARYCEQHAPKRKPSKRSGPSPYDAEWRRVRKRFLAAHPYCCDLFGIHAYRGEVALAVDVDHIVPLREGGTNDEENLRGLCRSCHSRRTGRDQSGAHKRKKGPVGGGGSKSLGRLHDERTRPSDFSVYGFGESETEVG